MSSKYKDFEEIIEVQNRAIDLQVHHWAYHELFTFQFWALLFLLFAPWFAWWKVVDKKRLAEILLHGLLVMTLVTLLDELGCQLNLWEYFYDIEPLFPRMIPINFTVLPVSYMLVYQYFSRWKTFLIAQTLLAALLSFLAEPLFVQLGIYVMFKWKYIYSFPIYIIVAILMKMLTALIVSAQKAASCRNPGNAD